LFLPRGLAFDSQGNLYIADSGNARVRKVGKDGNISTVAGSDPRGFGGDGSQATSARLNDPRGLAFDSSGNLYIADGGNFRIRKIATSGVITTVAGSGVYGPPQDGVSAIKSSLGMVQGLAFDSLGNLYFADSFNHVVFRLSTDGLFHIVANGGFGSAGDQGPAATAQLEFPRGMAVDRLGNVYVADAFNNRVRVISPGASVRAVAGTGAAGAGGDYGPAVAASLNSPYDLAFDSQGNLYIADAWNSRVRKVHFLAVPSSSNATIAASPNPIPVSSPLALGQTTIYWNAPGYANVEVHVDMPTGPELSSGGWTGSAETGVWVTDGAQFFLVDAATRITLASLTVHLEMP
jgi:sugar lactone lactonase YvrE